MQTGELQIHKTKRKSKQLWEYVPKIRKTEPHKLNSYVKFKISPTHLLVYVWKVKAQKQTNKKKKRTQKLE